MPAKSRFFQVFNHSSRKWVKFDRELGKPVGIQKTAYAHITKYRKGKK